MKHFISILSVMLAFSAYASAQTWFCTEPGTRVSYIQKDAIGAPQNGAVQYAIKDVARTGSSTAITYDVTVADKSGASVSHPGCVAKSDGKAFTADAGAAMGQFDKGLDIKGSAPGIPENPVIGEKIADTSISIESLMANVSYTNIRFTKHEQVTTLAGSFDCWCLEYDVRGTVAFINLDTKVEQWMAKGVGEVLVITRNKGGKVQNVKELVNIVKM